MKSESARCSVVSDLLLPHGLYSPWNSPGQDTGVGGLSLLQGTFPTQRLNPGFLALQVDSLPAEPQGKPINLNTLRLFPWKSCYNQVNKILVQGLFQNENSYQQKRDTCPSPMSFLCRDLCTVLTHFLHLR